MKLRSDIAMMTALSLPERAGETVPEWIHILPKGGEPIATHKGDGPYRYARASELIAASMGRKQRVIVDVNHSTFLSGARGGDAPAVGYITDMEARDDGIWAKVDWTSKGQSLMSDRAYWGVSPVFRHTKAGDITTILNVSLTNEPNLRGLTALNQESEMDFIARLAEILGLAAGATEDAVADAVTTMHSELQEARDSQTDEGAAELVSQMSEIAVALGLPEASEAADVLKAAKTTGDDGKAFIALQSELKDVTTQMNELRTEAVNTKAAAFVDGAIKEGRVGVSVQRDRLIAMHTENPARTEDLIKAMPIIEPGRTIPLVPPKNTDGSIALNSEQQTIAAQLGIASDAFSKALGEDQKEA
ncbi:Mu-like prophage I protein [Thalassovita gelatinovora]|uniref:Mu-like prophage I protein n=1 Tax=Thalassovita gelatinovora TaxID=53501 RepID=A0A0P1FJL4_THAGE|nr:phage protease [Thalassovita gelatinovora]QIZ81567.1 hypothetical protein HFZ77_14310 [Thalassovita gelatinovora]CUH67987.1 Mu-like prophage I protein [Thalassovita gelatinovora]SEQ26894.1 Mu-like prophage I protein [Thalassovita gelatinovora]